MLGNGLYVSRDIEKSIPYGPVTFKLLVYPGNFFIDLMIPQTPLDSVHCTVQTYLLPFFSFFFFRKFFFQLRFSKFNIGPFAQCTYILSILA